MLLANTTKHPAFLLVTREIPESLQRFRVARYASEHAAAQLVEALRYNPNVTPSIPDRVRFLIDIILSDHYGPGL